MLMENAEAARVATLALREPTFGDWLACGDISRQTIVNPRDAVGEVAVEFRINPQAVAKWLARLSGRSSADLGTLPMSATRVAYRELVSLVPAFDMADPDPDIESTEQQPGGVRVPLSKPLPGHREQHTSVLVRIPVLNDYVECGDVYIQRALEPASDGQPRALEMKVDETAVARWFTRLTGLPMASLATMAYRDARQVFAHLKPLLRETGSEGNDSTPQPTSFG